MQTLCNLSGREGEVEGHQKITLDHKGEGGGLSGLKKDYILFFFNFSSSANKERQLQT